MDDKVFVQDYEMEAIGEALRKVSGTTDGYLPSEMPEAIKAASLRLATTKTAGGETVAVTDSAMRKPLSMKAYGKSTQKSYAGNQLVDFGAFKNNSISSLTANFENDTLTLVGDGTASYAHIQWDITVLYKNNAGKTLYFDYESLTKTTEGGGNMIQLNITKTDGTKQYNALYGTNDYRSAPKILDDTSVVQIVYLRIHTTNSSTPVANTITIVKPILQFGTAKLEYEPYVGGVPSPNPEYPQEIVSCGDDGSVEYGVYGKNMLGSLVTGSISADGIIDYSSYYRLITEDYVIVSPNTQYKVSVDIVDDNSAYTFVAEYDGDKNFIIRHMGKKEITTGEKTRYVKVCFSRSQALNLTVDQLINPMFGIDVTVYEPSKEPQFLTLSTPNGFPGIPLGATIPAAIANSPIHMSGVYHDGEQYYISDTVDVSRGKYVKKILETVFDGSSDEQWFVDGKIRYYSNYFIRSNIDLLLPTKNSVNANALCSHATITSADKTYLQTDFGFAFATNPQIYFYYGDTEPALEAWKAKLAADPITVYTILATPLETDLTESELEQYNSIKMNSPNTTILNDAGAYTDVEYVMEPEITQV